MLRLQRIPILLAALALLAGTVGAQEQPSNQTASRSQAKRMRFTGPDYTRVTGAFPVEQVPIREPAVLWKFVSIEKPSGRMFSLSDPVYADGTVYVADGSGQVFALKADDGTEIWRHKVPSRISGPLSLDPGRVYFGTEEGPAAVRRFDGMPVWQVRSSHGNESMPIPVDGRVYAAGYEGLITCSDGATGKLLWKYDYASDAPPDLADGQFQGARARIGQTRARPGGAACDGELYYLCVFDQSRILALDCQSGIAKWSFRAEGWLSAPPTIYRDRVYFSSQDKHIYCLERASGALVWKYKTASWLSTRISVHNGIVFVPCHSGILRFLNADSGEVIRTFKSPDVEDSQSLVYCFPLVTEKTVYFNTGSSGQLFAIDIATAGLQWKLRPNPPSELFTDPITDGQRIFLTSRQVSADKGEYVLLAIGQKP